MWGALGTRVKMYQRCIRLYYRWSRPYHFLTPHAEVSKNEKFIYLFHQYVKKSRHACRDVEFFLEAALLNFEGEKNQLSCCDWHKTCLDLVPSFSICTLAHSNLIPMTTLPLFFVHVIFHFLSKKMEVNVSDASYCSHTHSHPITLPKSTPKFSTKFSSKFRQAFVAC